MSHECVCLVDNSFLCFVDKRDGFAVIHVGMLEEGKVRVQFILWIRLFLYIKRDGEGKVNNVCDYSVE